MTIIEPTTGAVNRWRDLVDRLSYATALGKVDWNDGSRTDSITTEIGNNTIMLRRQGSDYIVTISDLFGSTIDSFSDVQLEFVGELPAYTALDELYKSVKRQLTGADQVLDEILGSLPTRPEQRK